MQENEINLTQKFYAALNTGNIEAVVELLDPQIVRIEFETNTYRGLEELRDHIQTGRAAWAEGRCEPEQFLTNQEKVVVFVDVKVRLKNKTEWSEGKVADSFAFKDGKITEFHSFFDKQKALNWAGIKQN